jgi:hypothetical protein
MNVAARSAASSSPRRASHLNETAALERRPHKATRAVVEVLGQPAPKALYVAFDAFNAEHFAGRLGAPLIFITPPSSPRALGDYITRDEHGLRSRIRLAPAAARKGERFMMDVLLHEMIHAWASEVEGDMEPGYRGHGPKFAAKCNAIGKLLGLGEVGVKGRGGLPDCAQWPMCVRPAGYYGDEVERPKKRAQPKDEDEPREERDMEAELRAAYARGFKDGVYEGERRQRLSLAKQVRRRARRLRASVFAKHRPRIAAIAAREADEIARAIETGGSRMSELRYAADD